MDNVPALGTAADLEVRAARIADPNTDLKVKHTVACELREMIETVRDADSARVLPHMIPALLEILKNGETSYNKETTEYQFRRVLLEILHRIPYSEVIRPHALSLFSGMLTLLRRDNEENGVTCCKTIIDLIRSFRAVNEELVGEFMAILQESLRNMPSLVNDVLSEDSPPQDPNVVLPSIRSFKVLAEMGMVVVTFVQSHRLIVLPIIQNLLPLNFEVLAVESPAQKKAREDYEAMGGYWSGMSPTVRNPAHYMDYIIAHIKMLSYLAYIMRGIDQPMEAYGDALALSALRILQDCPAHAITARRDLIVVVRHLISTPYRRAMLPHIEKLLDENVLLGRGVGSRETLRSSAYAAVADLVHHLKNDLNPAQYARVVYVYARLIHNTNLASTLHTVFAKMMFNHIDVITAKDTRENATRVIGAMLETCIDKVDAMTAIDDEIQARIAKQRKGDKDVVDVEFIEKARPVAFAVYAVEKPEDVIQESKLLFRTLLHGFRVCLAGLKKCEAPVPDGALIFRLFEGCIRCMSLFDAEPREANEAMDWFSGILLEVNLHVFQEVWTCKIDFFFEACQKRPWLLHICHSLFQREPVSPTLVSIVLKYLVERLPSLGEDDDGTAGVKLRLFKMAFGAVAVYPDSNEPVLASHLGTLIMDSFPLAANASKPTHYFHLLRALFRAIGIGGGKFELLYKEVLPLLPDMLESLNRQLLASDGQSRDMIVELCLTVPLRLTHLLPHLTYLMHPLTLALRGTTELVTQGLRTLELCIDNLTPDFLDPTLNTVLRELMEALHSHLKPAPANHHHAHTTIRILGKLGGRNRRLLYKEPKFEYGPSTETAVVNISFGGPPQKVALQPMTLLAAKILRRPPGPDRVQAYDYLEATLNLLSKEGIKGQESHDVFVAALEGVFDAIHLPEVQERALAFVRKLSLGVFDSEIRSGQHQDPSKRRNPAPLLQAYLDALPPALARDKPADAQKAQEVLGSIIHDLVALNGQGNIAAQDIIPPLHYVASRLSALCLEDSWVRKSAGCSGIKLMTTTPTFGVRWIDEREVDLVRTLLHILKDLPFDLPKDIDNVVDVLIRVLRVSRNEVEQDQDGNVNVKCKVFALVNIFFSELSSSNAVVRDASRKCIDELLLSTGHPAAKLLLPHRDRVLASIFAKPLRALPFPIQIGMIEAVRYCISVNAPMPELNDEILRLLHETVALADNDDVAHLGRVSNPRQASSDLTKLRVASIRLLTASMPMTDFFSKQQQTRQRVTTLYFKSLYSPSREVKEVAHLGLKMVLTHQTRLPRELLQTGLRPVLMNLADPKRLSVPGLEGLARLLELLTNYFKVEIGHKLLDHFKFLADPQMLLASSRLPLSDNEGITKLVRLANIFHLLPSAANIFLDNFVDQIVETEGHMHFTGQSPFSEPLAKYLDRYPTEAVDYFLLQLRHPRHVRTLRSILQGKSSEQGGRLAPNLVQELSSRIPEIVARCLKGSDFSLVIPGLQILDDLATLVPSWLSENSLAVDALLEVWRAEPSQPEQTAVVVPEAIERHTLMLSIFVKTLQETSRIDLLFDMVSVYVRHLTVNLVRTTHFLYHLVALEGSLLYRRNVLSRFLTWFDDPAYSWSEKGYFIRLVVTPTLLVHASRERDGLVNEDFVRRLHKSVWVPMMNSAIFGETDDMFIIELLHMTTVLVRHYPKLLDGWQKDIVKCAWHFIGSDDSVVKQTAYILAARSLEAFSSPPKFILKAWSGLLRPPHSEVRPLVRQALDILAPVLPSMNPRDSGHPPWAKLTRRLLAEEGNGLSQIIIIYQLIVRQPEVFYPVRALFIPHMVNTLSKLGLFGSSSTESRLLSIEVLQVMFNWEQRASAAEETGTTEQTPSGSRAGPTWLTPLGFRESMVSYLVRLATIPQDGPGRTILVPKVLTLLKNMLGPNGWSDVTVKLNFFSRALEQGDLSQEQALSHAVSAARVLEVVAADKNDEWYTQNCSILLKLIRKGLPTDEKALQDALHPIFERLLRLYPLPKEEDESHGEISEFHKFITATIDDGLQKGVAVHASLRMLQSVVTSMPERIAPFTVPLMKLLSRLTKENLHAQHNPSQQDVTAPLIIDTLDISRLSVAYLGEQRKWLLNALIALVEKTKSLPICRYILGLAKDWAIQRRDAYPTSKEKAGLLQKMSACESRGDQVFHNYLQLIYEIYTEPSLRRSELTSKLEQSFLIGCRARDPQLRDQFMTLLDSSVPRALPSRLSYIICVQNWDALTTINWIYVAVYLLLGSVDGDRHLITDQASALNSAVTHGREVLTARNVIDPIRALVYADPQTAHDIWVSVFPAAWACLNRREQVDITQQMISLLSREWHVPQADLRPNVIQALLAGIHACTPPMTLPPHLVKYLGKTYGAWHVALQILEATTEYVREDEANVRDIVYDSLADLYGELAENDLFYGLWRRRCMHGETNKAIALEQNGMWEQASAAYEAAQSALRAGSLPYSESEYCLWEDHWMIAAEKLQQWDTLYDLAKAESNQELMLECAWRIKDWAEHRETLEEQINNLPDVATPRRRVFQAFLSLVRSPHLLDKNENFQAILEEAMQLSLRKWHGLPFHLSAAHIPLLQHFQQFVELQEAVQIFGSLSTTNGQNLEKKSSDLKMVLQAWRERLPNEEDDISIWSDLVAWRQNVFNAINKAYIPLIPQPPPGAGAASNNSTTYGYRGYHETAWITNRFAHTARKHGLLEVCFTSLNKIYTLPNIEISEAFLKLREQARCHYQRPTELNQGLEVINNTNLSYFSTSQKAQFYTLKGMFFARFGRNDEANHAFGQAVQLDMTQAKSWAEWGRWTDRMFKENPTDMSHAANAVSCYLQAAGQYKNRKSRPLLTRILWLLSVEDESFAIHRAFDTYRGEAAFWYWITLLPQLCLSTSHFEWKQARYLLLNLAKHYPQASFFHLRTTKEEMNYVRRQQAQQAQIMQQRMKAAQEQAVAGSTAGAALSNGDHPMRDGTADVAETKPDPASHDTAGSNLSTQSRPVSGLSAPPSVPQQGNIQTAGDVKVQPKTGEVIEEIVGILKTAYPLLILSMETMVDQINTRFKATNEEEVYRLICMLLVDAIQSYVHRSHSQQPHDGMVPPQTVANIRRMSQNMTGHFQASYEQDFLLSTPTHSEYIKRLQRWRDDYEKQLDSRPRLQPLDLLSHYLTEFQYGKFDEIEVPGQYTEEKDTNQNFVRIQKFGPKFENCRTNGFSWKRFMVHGNDNSITAFSVQLPSARHCRREERVMQILQTFNGALSRKKESRQRNLGFHLPASITCGPNLRLLQTDSSYMCLQDIYDDYCAERGFAREDPVLHICSKLRKIVTQVADESPPPNSQLMNAKKDLYDEVTQKFIPENVLASYMRRTMKGPAELWRMKKQFALQVASNSFMTYVFCLNGRTPNRFHISRSTGLIHASEILPCVSVHAPVSATSEAVPFRFTNNMQHFMGPIFMEGILTSGIMAIGRCLTEPEFNLEQQLCLFSRDEVMTWLHARKQSWKHDLNFRQSVYTNIDALVKRAETMACKIEREEATNHTATNVNVRDSPVVVQTVTNLISTATNPVQLVKMGESYVPWF